MPIQIFATKRSPRSLALALFFLSLILPFTSHAKETLDFVTLRLGSGSRVVLVVGGIQGDEPGGFSAATLLGTRYTITEGAVWIVPNLNFPSIIKRSRGLHGDMNRKFAHLDAKDPEYTKIRRIQELIRDPSVQLVLNLHDGSGYYRPQRENALYGPHRWGQSIVIDQEVLPGAFMGALAQEANAVMRAVNTVLIQPQHKYHVHNTRTAEGDKEMEKSLSYYAVRQGKAAFGLEASKEFGVALRAYYHLCMIENFLQQAGVRFQRSFELTPNGVEKALRENLGVSFLEQRIFLPLEDVRPNLLFLPLPKDALQRVVTSKPIMAVLPCEKNDALLCVHYGNRVLTRIMPEWRPVDTSLDGVHVHRDDKEESIPFGSLVRVKKQISVTPVAGYRVNAIGFDSGKEDESGLLLRRSHFQDRFSVDKRGRIYRIEVYKGEHFCGLFLIQFDEDDEK